MNKRKMKKELSRSFAKDLKDKKGILFLDFDGTIICSPSEFIENNLLNKMVHEDLSMHQDTVKNLQNLKKDYLIISVTWWPIRYQVDGLSKGNVLDCFDYLTTPNGTNNSAIYEIKKEKFYKVNMRRKYNVLDFIYKRVKNINNFDKLKLISFEDEPHYFEYIDEFIYVKTQFTTDGSISNFHEPEEVRRNMNYKAPKVKYNEIFFNDKTVADGVAEYIKSTLLI